MDLRDKNVLVIGLGKSGRAASLKLKELGAKVLASDTSERDEMKELAYDLKSNGIDIRLGKQNESLLNGTDLVVVSPGVPSKVPVLKAARTMDLPIWGEVELAYHLTDKPIIAITGTNGKTTTTTLIGKVFEKAGEKTSVAGNIGTPLVSAVEDKDAKTLIVEISSFQLDTIVDFRPKVAVVLNITEDHLDWHPDFTDYVRAKNRIFMNQLDSDFAVVNLDDEVVRSLVPDIRAHVIGTSKHEIENGVFIKNGRIIARLKISGSNSQDYIDICGVDEVKIHGGHNLDNIMAVAGVCLSAGIDIQAIRKTVISFSGLEHRTEYVATVNEVDYFNDSKATNVDATAKALMAFSKPIILLVGGRNKGNDFKPLAQSVNNQVKAVIGFGEAGKKILEVIPEGIPQEYAVAVDEAVILASELAEPGQIVLFSPACASFDAFKSYVHRGEVFKRAVLALREGNGEKTIKG